MWDDFGFVGDAVGESAAWDWSSWGFDDTSFGVSADSFGDDLWGGGDFVIGNGDVSSAWDWQGGIGNVPNPVSDGIIGLTYSDYPVSINEVTSQVADGVSGASDFSWNGVMGGLQSLWSGVKAVTSSPSKTASGGAQNKEGASGSSTINQVGSTVRDLLVGYKNIKSAADQVKGDAKGVRNVLNQAVNSAGPRPYPTSGGAQGAPAAIGPLILAALVGLVVVKLVK